MNIYDVFTHFHCKIVWTPVEYEEYETLVYARRSDNDILAGSLSPSSSPSSASLAIKTEAVAAIIMSTIFFSESCLNYGCKE